MSKWEQNAVFEYSEYICLVKRINGIVAQKTIESELVRCKECKKSHIDGKTTHYLWCTEWGRSTDTFGYCERGEREGE